MAPFNMASNTSSEGTMLNASSTLDASRTSMKDTHVVNSERTTSMLHNLQTDDFFSLTQLLDGGDGASIVPMQEGTLNQQPLNDHLNEISAFSMDDMFSNMHVEVRTFLICMNLCAAYELLSWTCVFKSKFTFSLQDFTIEDDFMGGEEQFYLLAQPMHAMFSACALATCTLIIRLFT